MANSAISRVIHWRHRRDRPRRRRGAGRWTEPRQGHPCWPAACRSLLSSRRSNLADSVPPFRRSEASKHRYRLLPDCPRETPMSCRLWVQARVQFAPYV